MNAVLRIPESEPRHRWTWDEVMKMADAGLFERDDGWRVELIDGELIDVAPQSLPHVRVKSELIAHLIRTLDRREWFVVADGNLVAGERDGPQPDTYVFPRRINLADVKPADVVFLAEVSLTSLRFDLGAKALLYAQRGVQEYWVFDCHAWEIVIHEHPGPEGYGSTRRVSASQTASPVALPSAALAFDQLRT